MRNFSKSLISMAAVMAVGSAMAAGAMAEPLTNINYADDTVTFSGVTAGKSQYTLLVVEGTKAADATEYTYDATEATIKQIDQNDAGVAFTEAVVGELADGSYKVLVGNNDGTIDSGIFTVGGTVEPVQVIAGDVDGSTKVNSADATCVFRYTKNRSKQDKNTASATYTANTADKRVRPAAVNGSTDYLYGDVNDDAKVNSADATCIFRYTKNRSKQDFNTESTTYTANTANPVDVMPEG